MLAAALLATGLFLLVGGLTPATTEVPVLQTGLALLGPLALAALTPLRRLALPIGLGAVTGTAALVASPRPDLALVVVPAVVAAVTARLVTRVTRAGAPNQVEPTRDRTTDDGRPAEDAAAEDVAAEDVPAEAVAAEVVAADAVPAEAAVVPAGAQVAGSGVGPT
jgi:hypothetical protein